MGFNVPAEDDTPYADQAEPDPVDLGILAGMGIGTSVRTGMAVTAQVTPGGTVAVSAGTYRVSGVAQTYAGGNVSVLSGSTNTDSTTPTAADATYFRYDLVVGNASGQIGVLHGDVPTPTWPDYVVNPRFPDVDFTTHCVLAALFIPPTAAGITGIQSTMIVRKDLVTSADGLHSEVHAISNTTTHTGSIVTAQGLGKPQALTGATQATNYVGGTAAIAPVAGTFAVGDYVVSQTGRMFVCTIAGSPGTWAQVGQLAAPQNLTLFGTGATWTDQPAAPTEFLGTTTNRHSYDFTALLEARFKLRCITAGFAGAILQPQYSTDDTTYQPLASTLGALDLTLTAAGTKRTAWVAVAAGAKVDPCYIRIVGSGGNAVADPVVGQIELEVR